MPRPPKPPDVRQRYAHECGVGVFQAACKAFGKRKIPRPKCGTRYGTFIWALRAACAEKGLTTQMGDFDLEELLHHLRRGRLVFCTVPVEGEGHWIIVWKVRAGRVWIQDPDTGPRTEPLDKFLPEWKRQNGGLGVAVGPG